MKKPWADCQPASPSLKAMASLDHASPDVEAACRAFAADPTEKNLDRIKAARAKWDAQLSDWIKRPHNG